MLAKTDYYEILCSRHGKRSLEDNLRYRSSLWSDAEHDVTLQQDLLAACREDILFFLNAFTYVYEPRPRLLEDGRKAPKTLPFITWPHQDPAIVSMVENLGSKDVVVVKSRGEGASWIGVMLALHQWLFFDDVTIGMASSTMDKTDKQGHRGSLLGKIDWELNALPIWMVGDERSTPKGKGDWVRNSTEHTLRNLLNGSVLVGVTSTKGTGRGDRYDWFLLDELAEWDFTEANQMIESLQQSTESRLIISTPDGPEGAYANAVHQPSNKIRIDLNWYDNPTRNRGLYKFVSGSQIRITAVDEKNPLLSEYDPPQTHIVAMWSRLRARGFPMEGLRSPWFDNECDRANATPEGIAKELEKDFGRSMSRIFGEDFFNVADKAVLAPSLRGVFDHHPERLSKGSFDRTLDGPVALWCNLGPDKRPPQRKYVAGIDISSGQGGSHTSNSVIAVVDMLTQTQVAEFATNTMEPGQFADFCMSLCYWFHTAFMVWEANYGGNFGTRVIEKGYPDVYHREIEWKRTKRIQKEIGWWSDDKTKERLFSDLKDGVRMNDLIPRSRELIAECGQYIRDNKGKISHVASIKTVNQHAKGKQHGDRVIAFALCWRGIKQRPSLDKPLSEGETAFNFSDPPPFTAAARLLEFENSILESSDEWDDRDIIDLSHGHGTSISGGFRG